MNVCVFCAVNEVDDAYAKDAQILGAGIAAAGHTLVWGGSNKGTMKTIADAAQENGGRIVGITVDPIKHMARANADEMIITQSWGERKATMLERSDTFIILPGGIGTFDEMGDILESKKHRVHDKQIFVLNVEGFYDGLQQQFETMETLGFLTRPLSEMLVFTNSPHDILDAL